MRRLVIFGLLLACLVPRGAGADEDLGRLRALADAKHTAHEEAAAWWVKYPHEARVALLRRALASEDKALAAIGARGIGWPYLGAAETGRRVNLLIADSARDYHARPAWALLQERPLGSPEVVAYVGWAVAEPDRFPGGSITTAHRVMQGAQIEALLPWVANAPAASLHDVLFLVANTGEADREDRHRRAVAEGLLSGLRRIRALRAGEQAPRWEDLQHQVHDGWREGLPPALVELARATHTDRTDGFAHAQAERGAVEGSVRPFHVLRRWLLETTPSTADQAFLHEVVKLGLGKGYDIYAPVHELWAMEHLAGMPGPKGKDAVVAWARGSGGPTHIVAAATALARLEDRSHFDRLRKAIDDGTFPKKHRPYVDYTWLVDRDEARARAVTRLLAPDAGPIKDNHVLAVEPRHYIARDYGIRITRPDLDVIAKGLWDAQTKDQEHVFRLLHFHAHIDPASLTVDRAQELLKRLRRWLERADRSADEPWKYRDEETLDRALALLEVRAPDATAKLLRWWVMHVDEGRMYALERFARLGRVGLEDETLALWEDEEFGWQERWLLGRTPGDEIDVFLRHKGIPDVDACTPDQIVETFDALHALFLREGLPRTIAPLLEPLRLAAEDDPDAYAGLVDKAYRATNRGDAIAGVLALAEAAEFGIHALGGIDDERVHAWLRARRENRASGLAWEATLALAGHDSEAADDVLRLIREGRTWLLENLEGGGIAHGPQRAFTEALTAGLDTNCCLGWICHVLLKEIHPWLPYDEAYGGAGTRATRALLGRHAWKRSEIFDGPVPAPR